MLFVKSAAFMAIWSLVAIILADSESFFSAMKELAVTIGIIATIVVQVMTKLEQNRQAKVLAITHSLVNSALGEQKKLVAVSARGKADATHDMGDIQTAMAAEKVYADHIEAQKSLDDKIAGVAPKEEAKGLAG